MTYTPGTNKLNILLIEDKIQDIQPVLDKVNEMYKDSLELNFISIPIAENNKDNLKENILRALCNGRLNDDVLHLCLLDLELQGLNGLRGEDDILQELERRPAIIPIFILTWSGGIKRVVHLVKKYNCEGYIHKSQLQNLNKTLLNYFEETELTYPLNNIGEPNKSILFHNHTLWKRHPDILWHGDKLIHMTDHGWPHHESVWKNVIRTIKTYKNIKNEELFVLCMAIWLHDIGHKGCKREMQPNGIRGLHGLISGELLTEYNEIIRGTFEDNGETIKKIALICAYHMQSTPLNEKVKEMLDYLDEEIPNEFKVGTEYQVLKNNNENLDKYKGFYILKDQLVFTCAILRFVDACDMGSHRTYTPQQENTRKNNAIEEILYYKEKLKNEYQNILEKLGYLKYEHEILKPIEDFMKEYLPGVDKYIENFKELYKSLYSESNTPVTFYEETEKHYKTIYENLFQKFHKEARKTKKIFTDKTGQELIKEWDISLKQVFSAMEGPLLFISRRVFKGDWKIEYEKSENNFFVEYKFNDSFININENNQKTKENFIHSNWLFQEAWKAYVFMNEEIILVKDILENNRLDFNRVDFILKEKGEVGKEDRNKFSFCFGFRNIQDEKRYIIENPKDKTIKDNLIKNIIIFLKKNGWEDKDLGAEAITDIFYDNSDYLLSSRGWALRTRNVEDKITKPEEIEKLLISPIYWGRKYKCMLVVPTNKEYLKSKSEKVKNISNIYIDILENAGKLNKIFNISKNRLETSFTKNMKIDEKHLKIKIKICIDTDIKINILSKNYEASLFNEDSVFIDVELDKNNLVNENKENKVSFYEIETLRYEFGEITKAIYEMLDDVLSPTKIKKLEESKYQIAWELVKKQVGLDES